MKHELTSYRYRGARAMVLMHEKELRRFIEAWRDARKSGVPTVGYGTDNEQAYLDLMYHVLACARSYMVWLCRSLELPDPNIDPTPTAEQLDMNLDKYVDHLLEQWRIPLAEVEEERFDTVRKSNWNIEYCLDSMLEHAVMHPYRHRFQILEWMER